MENKTIIEFKDVTKKYSNGHVALKNINLSINKGEFVFIVGHSGAGKTTLTKLLMCEEYLTSGSLTVNGFKLDRIPQRKVPFLRRTMGIVFQDFRLFDNMTVYDNIAFAMRVIGEKPKIIKKRLPYFLDLINLTDKANCYPSELSGGEQQRVAFARALVNNPEIIIADEPTGNNDPRMSLEIMDLLVRMNKLEKTVIVVTHEKNLVDFFRKRVITINDSTIVSDRIGGAYDETI